MIEDTYTELGDEEILGSYLNIEQDEAENHENTSNINQKQKGESNNE